jgi:hypothetical protein
MAENILFSVIHVFVPGCADSLGLPAIVPRDSSFLSIHFIHPLQIIIIFLSLYETTLLPASDEGTMIYLMLLGNVIINLN